MKNYKLSISNFIFIVIVAMFIMMLFSIHVNAEETTSTLLYGSQFNSKIKQLVKSDASYSEHDNVIENICFIDDPFTSDTTLQSSGEPVYARLNENTIELYSNADIVYAHENCMGMFCGLLKLKSVNIDKINFSNTQDISHMFDNCESIENINLSELFITANQIKKMNHAFYYCENLKSLDFSNINLENVTDISYLCNHDRKLAEICFSNIQNVNKCNNLFGFCYNLTKIEFKGSIPINIETNYTFYIDDNNDYIPDNEETYEILKISDSSHIYLRYPEAGGSEFNETLKKLINPNATWLSRDETVTEIKFINEPFVSDIQLQKSGSPIYVRCKENIIEMYVPAGKIYVEDASYMFNKFAKVKSIDLSLYNFTGASYLNSMFSDCASLKSIDLSNLYEAKATNINSMFSSCSSLESLDMLNFDTSNVTTMGSMFSGCTSLKSLDLSNFDTSKVTKIYNMFNNCSSLESLDLSSFNTSNVTDISGMFYGCKKLKSLDLSNFDTTKVTTMGGTYYNGMFKGCLSLEELDISYFTITEKTEMKFFLSNCPSLKRIKAPKIIKKPFMLPIVNDQSWYMDNDENLIADGKRKYKDLNGMFDQSYTFIRNDIEGFSKPVFNTYLQQGSIIKDILSQDKYENAEDIIWIEDPWLDLESSDNIAKTNELPVYVSKQTRNVYKIRDDLSPKFAYTPNINENGIKTRNYDNYKKMNNTISINGAKGLYIKLAYETELYHDFVYVFAGEYTDNQNMQDVDNQEGLIATYTGEKNNVELYIEGDTVTFTFQSDITGNDYYGYYAEIIPMDAEEMSVITLYADADNVYLDSDSSYMFSEMLVSKVSMLQDSGTYSVIKTNATNINSMFKDCKNLNEIDMSEFELGLSSNTEDLFTGCGNLSKVTMCANSAPANISLPKAFVIDDDNDGVSDTEDKYNSIPSGIAAHTYIEIPPCIISFITGTDTPIDPITVSYGNKIERPSDPIKEHYSLIEWYIDDSMTTSWNFEDVVTGNMTLYAGWEQTEYLVTFYYPEEVQYYSIWIEKNNKITDIPTTPEKDHFQFISWCSDEALNSSWNFDNDVVSKDISLYAKFEQSDYLVNYYLIGDDIDTLYHSCWVKKGDKITDIPSDPNKMYFVGWSTSRTTNEAWDFENDTVLNDITLYDHYGNVDYTITVPDEITWDAGYFDVNFECDKDYIGSATFTITSNELDFSERGYKISFYSDYDKTISFTSYTFTQSQDIKVYIKKEYVGNGRAGLTTKYITFDIAS